MATQTKIKRLAKRAEKELKLIDAGLINLNDLKSLLEDVMSLNATVQPQKEEI